MPVPPISSHALLVFLAQVSLLLLLALLLGRIAIRVGLPAVVGELTVGVLLGPSVLGHFAPGVADWLFQPSTEQFHLLDALGQLGVVLLVGMTGVHIDVAMVRRRGGVAAGVSIGGLVVPLGFGIAVGFALSATLMPPSASPLVFALFLGVALCVSAMPVIAKILMDMRMMHRNIGQLVLTAGMVDDAFGWMMLSIVSALATTGLRTGDVMTSLLSLLVVVVFALTLGRLVARAGFKFATKGQEVGPAITLASAMIIVGALATHALHLEAVFGAFVVGMLISSALGVERSRLAPLRTVVLSVFAPIFFAMAGLRMDLTSLWTPKVFLAGAIVLTVAILGKFIGAYAGARISRLNHWEALALGAGLNARGVIEVVVAMAGLRLGILSAEAYTIIVLVAIVTSFMAPPILRYTMSRIEHTAEERLRESRDLPPVGQPEHSPSPT